MPDTFSVPEYLDVGVARSAVVIGTIVSIEGAQLDLSYPDRPETIEVTSLVNLGPDATGTVVALGFIAGDRARPLILGPVVGPVVLAAPESEALELEQELEAALDLGPEFDDVPLPISVSADGRQLRIEAREELQLRCGKASITLRANGRVIVRGTQVESRAKGLNRIKGGAVAIN